MSPDREDLWADMAQFDTRLADGVWDADVQDPDAPPWYADLVALIRRARGPAEAHELADEPVVVATMRRATLCRRSVRAPRRRVRSAARVVAMKATAAIATTSMAGVAAAAATGAVATVAVTMAVPAINRHVVPMILDHGRPPAVSPAPSAQQRSGAPDCDDGHQHSHCILDGGTPLPGTAHPAGTPGDPAPPTTEPAPDAATAPPTTGGTTRAAPTTALDAAPDAPAPPTTGAAPSPPVATTTVPAEGTATTTASAQDATTTTTPARDTTTTTVPAPESTGTDTGSGTGTGHTPTVTAPPAAGPDPERIATRGGTRPTTTPADTTTTTGGDPWRAAEPGPTIEPRVDGAGTPAGGGTRAGRDRGRPDAPHRPASADAAGSPASPGPPAPAPRHGPRR